MVSLSRQPGSGRYPFDEWSQSGHETEDLLDVSYSRCHEQHVFRPIRTTWSIVCVLLCLVAYEVAVFSVPHFCGRSQCGVSSYSILLYSHGAMWFLLFLADRFWRYLHYHSRTIGYLDFYRQTRHIRRFPVVIFSGGCALLLIVITLMEDYCHNPVNKECPGMPLERYNYLQIIVSVEVAILLPTLILYLVQTVKFNKLRSPPDVQQEEVATSLPSAQPLANGVGFRDETFIEDVLEKQADMIRYLKHHNKHLGRKILQLTSQLEQVSPASC